MPIKWGAQNESIIHLIDKELPQSTFYWLLISNVVAIVWIIYLTYYNSRVLGIVLTAICNRLHKYGHIKFGSISVSVLSGKVMFRDVHYVTQNYSIRVQLGYAVFRWWRPLTDKEVTDDLSHQETRLSVFVDNFELHVYNRTGVYSRLERLFGLEQLIEDVWGDKPDSDPKSDDSKERPTKDKVTDSGRKWRDLIPVIKFEVSSGRVVFGNHLVPTCLSVNFDDAHIVYTTKPASTPFDLFMHIVKCKSDNIRIMLIPSPKYKGVVDEMPRSMGEGFVVIQSNDVELYYYYDEPGLVPYEPEQVQLANGEVVAMRTWPCFGMDVKCGKGTDINYGPWADRQREALWKLFYPADYQPLTPTELPGPGQTRMFRNFDFKLSTQGDSTFDVLFTKNKETQALHVVMQAGSYLEFSIPWITEETGFVTKINGQLMHIEASTSLQFRQLLEAETFGFDIEAIYPRHWNEHQTWKCDLTACKSSGTFIFEHKVFFMDLINDWSTREIPDIYHFVPYTWKVNITMKEFELATLCNQWNWVDCFGQTPENGQIAFCGETFDLSFDLPYVDFLPPIVPINFFIRGESVDCRLYLAETNTSRHVILAIAENMKICDRQGNILDEPFISEFGRKWRRNTHRSAGWVDCWTTPIVAINVGYIYHPVPPSGEDSKPTQQVTTPNSEEKLLEPLRLEPIRPLRPSRTSTAPKKEEEFDAGQMDPDVISVELEVAPSTLCVYGNLITNFYHVKENYLGEDQKPIDFDEKNDKESNFEFITVSKNKKFDPRQYRPFAVNVVATIHDVHAHLVKNCNKSDQPCPNGYVEKVVFEMDKKYEETILQVLVSPVVLICKDKFQGRPDSHGHLQDGHLALSGIQVRGHAMFSHKGLPLDSETLEYSWMVEVTVGDLTGRLSAPQLQRIIEFLQTFVFLIEDSENNLQHPLPYKTCQHGVAQPECKVEHVNPGPCLTSDDIKYRMTRVSVDCVDVYLVEAGTALNVQIYPLRLATCNLHGQNNKAGITGIIQNINMKQFVLSIPLDQRYNSERDCWLEAGGVCLGPLSVDAAMALPDASYHPIQDQFLKLHDNKTRRLWFLWPPDPEIMDEKVIGKCGCCGGSRFFGSNRNGSRFFKPSEHDFNEGINSAVYYIINDGVNFGFAQSIHHRDQLVFDVQGSRKTIMSHRVKLHSTSKPYRPLEEHIEEEDNPIDFDALLEGSTLLPGMSGIPGGLVMFDKENDESRSNLTMSSEHTLQGSMTLTRDLDDLKFVDPEMMPLIGGDDAKHDSDSSDEDSIIHEVQAASPSSIPSDYLPESPMPDAYDTDRYISTPSDSTTWNSGAGATSGSATSLPDAFGRTADSTIGHERKSSDPPLPASPMAQKKLERSSNGRSVRSSGSIPLFIPGSPTSMQSSKGSMISRMSSLTSPVLRRLSSQMSVGYDGSLTSSLTGSEHFFSAMEEFSDRGCSSPENANLSLGSNHETTLRNCSSDITMDSTMQRTVIGNPLLECSTSSEDDTDTDSGSIHSFVSAMSSQMSRKSASRVRILASSSSEEEMRKNATIKEEDATLEEPGDDQSTQNLLDLHGQINQPITKSPLLMTCYMKHMTKLQCSHWLAGPPRPSSSRGNLTAENEAPRTSTSLSDEYNLSTTASIPQFAYIREGFTPRLMVKKKVPQTPPGLSSPSVSSDKHHEYRFFPSDDEDSPQVSSTCNFEDHVSKTTAVVKLEGSVDVMFSPLMLEALQRYVEACFPVLSNLHPSSIVDSLHSQCSNSVKAQNTLKQRETENAAANKAKQEENSDDGAASSKTSRLQIMFSLSKINICILQASLVEEMISMSHLDKVQELTCVSVLAVCLDNLTCQVLVNNRSQMSIEGTAECSPESTSKKLPTEKLKQETGGDEDTELQQEDIVGNLHIDRIHIQLRRMKKNSYFSDNVFLTAIPEYRSKTLFTFKKEESPTPEGLTTPVSKNKQDTNNIRTTATPEDIAGFIMFETGLEDITLKAAKRSGYQESQALPAEENLQAIDKMIRENIKHRRTQVEITIPASDEDTTSPMSDETTDETQQTVKENAESQDNTKSKRESLLDDSNEDSDVSGAEKADDELSWQSRVSVDGSADEVEDQTNKDGGNEKKGSSSLQGDASSVTLEFKTVWFNFAAPPPSPKKKKLEFTRFDWNLLSTATPAINAWMNPSHRAMVAAKTLVRKLNYRISTVMACIMTEALDVQGIHMPVKSKFSKITSLSRTLQEDPSCQLSTVLRRYLHRVGNQVVEDALTVDTIPQLITIRKGLLALTRQWKNVLYMPILADTNFKSKKRVQPYTVTFAIPKDTSEHHMQDEDYVMDNCDVIDERTSLLGSQHSLAGSQQRVSPPGGSTHRVSPEEDGGKKKAMGMSSESIPRPGDKRAASATDAAKAKAKGNTFPVISLGDSPSKHTARSGQSQTAPAAFQLPTSQTLPHTRLRRNESNVSVSSVSSIEVPGPSQPGTPLRQSLTRHLNQLEKREDLDLYRWMQRQQDYTRLCHQPNLHYYPSMGQDSLLMTGISEYSVDDDTVSLQRLATMTQTAVQMVDAQVLFKPMLSAIGLHLEAVKTSAIMKKVGGNISIKGVLSTLRVDIVDSEISSKSKKGKHKKKKMPTFHIDMGLDTPAFISDHFAVMICMKDIIDFEKEKELESDGSIQDLRRKSFRAIKLAMDHMEAKPTTTKVTFSVNCHSITQHVNMSLLRLTHQFVTMIENINETRTELKGITSTDTFRGHRKQDSKGSSTETETDTQSLGEGVEMPKSTPPPPPPRTYKTTLGIGTPPVRRANLAQSRPDKLAFAATQKSSAGMTPSLKENFEVLPGKSKETETAPTRSGVQSSPVSANYSDTAIDMHDTSSPALAEKTIVDEIKENTPKCWRTLYHLLDLYANLPETKTLTRKASASKLSVIDEEPGSEKNQSANQLPTDVPPQRRFSKNKDEDDIEMVERQPLLDKSPQTPMSQFRSTQPLSVPRHYTGNFTHSVYIGERTPLIIFGMAKVKRVKMSAMLSGLKLEADMQNVHASATHTEKIKGVFKRKSSESSATAYVGHSMVVLLEGVPPNMQTVVTVNIAKSQGLHSSYSKKSRLHNSTVFTVGKVEVDIPQHPVVLHGMVARSSKRLSNTLQEFMRPPYKTKSHDSTDSGTPSAQPSRHSDISEGVTFNASNTAVPGASASKTDATKPEEEAPKPIQIHFKAVLQGLTVGASLLPSLKAQYKMGVVTSSGVTGKKARFNVDLPTHSLSFTSKLPESVILAHYDFYASTLSQRPPRKRHNSSDTFHTRRPSNVSDVSIPRNLPSSASVDLPPVHIHADYREHSADTLDTEGGLTEGLTLRDGDYLNAVAEVGTFEHSLTTDLLNHLVFVQKVFMKEVQELVQKVSGGDQPVPVWGEEGFSLTQSASKPFLYSLYFKLKGIQITATTPTNSAVRLETSTIELELSNRVKTAKREKTIPVSTTKPKVFVKVQLELNVALGSILKNPMFEEADPEFHNLASFNTMIALRNALQDEMIPGVSKDQEALLLSVNRPIVFVQPIAFDKAVLVWLNYKNAYEYWNNEQTLAFMKESEPHTQDKPPHVHPETKDSQTDTEGQTASGLSTLFLQLTVDDLGICLPMNAFSQGLLTPVNKMVDEPGAALVLTLESTRISACSYGSLVSKGKFKGFCLRFANDFEVSWDDWKPDMTPEQVMNAMVVPEGTYEVCSRTAQANEPYSNAKWILNVKWQMQGIDIHLDTNIGKQLTILGNSLTSFAGDQEAEEEIEDPKSMESTSDEDDIPTINVESAPTRKISTVSEGLPEFVYDTSIDPKTKARLIEKEMNEQAKVLEDLRTLGASQSTIEMEQRKLQELEAAVFQDFRLDLIKKLKRQSVRATAIRDKLGLGYKPASTSHTRPKSASNYHRRKERAETLRLPSYQEENELDSPTHSSGSPISGHSRTLSFDACELEQNRPRFDISPSSVSADRHLLADKDYEYNIMEASSSDSDVVLDMEEGKAEAPHRAFKHSTSKDSDRSAKVTSPIAMSQATSRYEPSVDFELDVKVVMDSGKFVLHPKEPKDEPDTKSHSKKDMRVPGSPKPERKKLGKKASLESTPRGLNLQTTPLVDNNTVFFMPGVDVKLHYKSNYLPGEGQDTSARHDSTFSDQFDLNSSSASVMFKKNTIKKANLYTWISLQQLSEEMLISPALLDFLEQALEPIPTWSTSDSKTSAKPSSTSFKSSGASSAENDMDISANSLGVSSSPAYMSFPVDVVVYIKVKPSYIRFTCLPVSRVECLLRLPSLDVVFSTKKVDEEEHLLNESTSAFKPKNGVYKKASFDGGMGKKSSVNQMPSYTRTASKQRLRNLSGVQSEVNSGGGLSVSACLADFSLYIFHPYQGGQKKSSHSMLYGLDSSFKRSKIGEMKDSFSGSPLQDTTPRKDSLSLNVEFVKVNISRSRKGLIQSDILGLSSARLAELQAKAANSVRFSAIIDIGSASFNYDMRRLSEILALPKAWYRRSLARRMFLGEEATLLESESDAEFADMKTGNDLKSSASPKAHQQVSPVSSSSDTQVRYQDTQPHGPPQGMGGNQVAGGLAGKTFKDWETLVLFAVNLSRLDVNVNMSNVMGNTVWNTHDIKSKGRLSIDSNGFRDMQISAGLGGSKLEARGGIVGGNIELQQFNTFVMVSEDPGRNPDHKMGLQLEVIELRADYMGSSVLIGRFSQLQVELADEWRVDHSYNKAMEIQPLATKRPALIFVHGDLTWDKLHLMISRSTTPDLIKMVNKLEEFFTQQFNSSKRVLSAFGPIPGASKPRIRRKNSSDSSWISEIRHHRHWQKVLERVSGCKFPMLSLALPQHGTILGGIMGLHGNNLTLACFHGINFRSKSWALFTLEEPVIRFATEATDIVDFEETRCTHIVQNLTFQLSHNLNQLKEKKPVARILKISRGHYMPPPFNNVQDWFHYAYSTSIIPDLDNFPHIQKEIITSSLERRTRRQQDHNHECEQIFVLPSLRMELKTEHLQGNTEPTETEPRPQVECSFVTEFEDHILVAMDAEVILFLHDLVTNYVKEKDRGIDRMKSPETEKKNLANPTTVLKQDFRDFRCNTWHLEPKVRLISWAGKRIDPVGVDYVLQKLGFQHARLTIPKWVQRGFMDPLDKISSMLMDKLFISLKDTSEEGEEEGAGL